MHFIGRKEENTLLNEFNLWPDGVRDEYRILSQKKKEEKIVSRAKGKEHIDFEIHIFSAHDDFTGHVVNVNSQKIKVLYEKRFRCQMHAQIFVDFASTKPTARVNKCSPN